jgi:hypothetical protein
VSYHWNNFLWPLAVTNSVNTRPLTVGLAIFGAPESGVDWSVISAGTLIAVAPLLVAFLLFQRQFMQSFMQAGSDDAESVVDAFRLAAAQRRNRQHSIRGCLRCSFN